jgi:hypothetical protein
MFEYIVDPLRGIAPVLIGMSRDEVRRVMSEKPQAFRKTSASQYETDAFHGAAFQVFYAGDQPCVEYIELSRSPHLIAMFRGINVFETPAEDLVRLISQYASYDESDREIPYSYIFPSLEMSLWRPVVEDEERRFFSTIGIGIRGYYSEGGS